jgi:flavin-dependent dehydrogenase
MSPSSSLKSKPRVAIVGAGPAGSALGLYLARSGCRPIIYSKGKRPPIIVGESLVPAVVPFLREFGIEQEVASYSTWKSGATFVYNQDYRLNIWFDQVRGGRVPTYSYNVPRDRFDATIRDAAERAGATVVEHAARMERAGDSDRLRLSDDTVAAAGALLEGRQPDFIVDATGRGRGIPQLLDIPVVAGDRRDSALHAHLTGVKVEIATNVHTDRLERGWCWRIPLPGRVSTGVIVDAAYLREFGATAEEQFDNYLRHEPVLREWSAKGERVTPVVRYSNYQARVERGVGANWALVGDAFGFVDPVFSSGMLIALQSARSLAAAIGDGSPSAFARYEAEVKENLDSWRKVITHYYDGRLLTLFQVGERVRERFLGKLMDFHFRKHMPRIFTGDDVTNRYSRWLVEFMSTYGIYGRNPDELRIN